MNATARRIALAAALGLSATAFAAERTTTLNWNCADEFPPTYREVAAFYEIQNPGQVHDARVSLHLTLQRTCANGARTAEVVRNDPANPEAIRIVAR
jgi:hypothetical protein